MPQGAVALYVSPPDATAVNPFPPSSGAQAEQRWVDKNGSDTTGDGTFGRPFLTIQKAIDTITDATTVKPYVVHVSPGVFATTFKLKAGVYVVGAGGGPGEYNGTPLLGATVIAPNAAQVLDTSFAGAGDATAGIIDCALSTAMVANFAAIGSTGPKTIQLKRVFSQSAVSLTGSGNLEYADIEDLYLNATVTLTFANMGGAVISNYVNDFGGGLVVTQSAAIQAFYAMNGGSCAGLTIAWTSALQANFLFFAVTGGWPFNTNQVTVTGLGATLAGLSSQKLVVIAATPAEVQFQSFLPGAAGSLIGCAGLTEILSNLGTDSAIILHKPTNGAQVIIKNQNAFNIALTFADGAGVTGDPSYIGPFGLFVGYFSSGTWMVGVVSHVQTGTVALAAGVSAFIPADISPQSSIVATLKTFNGATGNPTCKAADRVNGAKAGAGGFKVTSVDPATNATVASDNGTYDWYVSPGKA